MIDVFCDLETFGKGADAMIVSIGLISYDLREGRSINGQEWFIDPETALAGGATMDPSTVLWWMGQDDRAREPLVNVLKNHALPEYAVLQHVTNYMNALPSETILWGMGPSFDCAKLTAAFNRNGQKQPWKYSAENCVRTVRRIASNNPDCPQWDTFIREGVYHNAIDDALHQARYVAAVNQWFYQRTDLWLF